MRIPQRKIACWWSSESAVDSGFSMEQRHKKAKHSHPEQQTTGRVNGLRFHLLSAGPHLGSGRWGHLRRRDAVVNRGLSMEGKKEHQGTERDGHRAPQRLVWHDSKIQSLFCLTQRFYGLSCMNAKNPHPARISLQITYYTCEASISKRSRKTTRFQRCCRPSPSQHLFRKSWHHE